METGVGCKTPPGMAALYHATLQAPTAVTAGVSGTFLPSSHPQLVLARGGTLELLGWDASGGLHALGATDTFAVVRSLAVFRPAGAWRYGLCLVTVCGTGRCRPRPPAPGVASSQKENERGVCVRCVHEWIETV